MTPADHRVDPREPLSCRDFRHANTWHNGNSARRSGGAICDWWKHRFVHDPRQSDQRCIWGQGTQLGVQTGTVASTVTITPSFATTTGDVNITPTTPAVLAIHGCSRCPSADRRPSHRRGHSRPSRRANHEYERFTIQVTGFTTTRSLTPLVVQFGHSPGISPCPLPSSRSM